MGRKGYLKFYRSMLSHPLWLAEPFTKGQAFWDLVARANHADAELLYGNTIVSVKRGQLFTSEVKLAERWQWSRNKVRRYLKLLESMKMSTATSTGLGTLITIENYSVYQDDEPAGGTALEPANGQGAEQQEDRQGTGSGTQTKRIEKNKEEQEELNNNIYSALGEFQNVSLSEEELEKLKERFPYDWQERIESLSAYMKSKNKRYKSHYATILTWARKDGNHEGKQADSKAEGRAGSAAGAGDEYEKFFK